MTSTQHNFEGCCGPAHWRRPGCATRPGGFAPAVTQRRPRRSAPPRRRGAAAAPARPRRASGAPSPPGWHAATATATAGRARPCRTRGRRATARRRPAGRPPAGSPPPAHSRPATATSRASPPRAEVRSASPPRVTSAGLYEEMATLEGLSKDEFEAWELAVADWEESYEAEAANYPSILLYCQMKLKEALGGGIVAEPDPFRVAVCCHLHSQLVRNIFGRYSSVMTVLHTEMLKGIYPSKEAGGARRSGWARAKHAITRPPYFVEARGCSARSKAPFSDRDLHAQEDFLKKENDRRAFAVKFTVKWWWMKVFNRMFSHWRMLTAHSRGVLARHVRNIQARRLRRVFWLWREWQLIRFVRRFRGLCEPIRPHVEVRDLAVSDSEDEDDEFERRRQQADRAAELRRHDVAYQCLLDEKQDSEAKVEEAQGHMALVAQELLATAPLTEHLSHGERGELFSRWTHLISAANVRNPARRWPTRCGRCGSSRSRRSRTRARWA